MAVYYIYIIYCLLLSFLSKFRESGLDKKKLAILLGLGLLFIMGLRSETVGNDVVRYLEHYKYVDYISIFETRTESGYVIFQKLLSFLNVGSQGFIFIISSIIVVLFSWFFYNYSKNVGFSFFLHFTIGLFAFTMTGFRQSIAIGLTLIAIHLAIKKKLIWYLIVVFVATVFHGSAIVFVPVYFIFQVKKYNFKIIALIFLVILFIGIFNDFLFSQISTFSTDKYNDWYLETVTNNGTSLIFIIFSFCLPAIVVLLWILDKAKINQLSRIDMSFFVMSLIGLMFILLSSQLSLLSRLSYYFMIGVIVLIPNTIENLRNRPLSRVSGFLLCVISILFFITANIDGISKIDTYLFFWE